MKRRIFVGDIVGDRWRITSAYRIGNNTKYILTNEDTLEEINVASHTLNHWMRKPQSFNPERYKKLHSLENIGRPKSVLGTVPRPKFISVEDEIKYCMHRIRYVKKCEECLRFNENCDTLAKLSGVKND